MGRCSAHGRLVSIERLWRAVSVVLALAGPHALGAQSVTETVLLRESCPSCRVTIQRIGQLGSDNPSDPIHDARGFNDLAALADGSVIALPARGRVVWSLTVGGKLRWMMGREGDGPGEFRQADQVSVVGQDTVVVYDRGSSRFTLVSGAGDFLSTSPALAGASAFVAFSGRSGVAMGRYGSQTRLSGLPLHLYATDSIRRSFGELVRVVDPRMPFSFEGILLRFGDEVVTVPRAGRFVVQRWDTLGRLVQRLAYEPEWFPPTREFVSGSIAREPSPMVFDSWIEESGRLWVLAVRAGSRWKDAFSRERVLGEGGNSIYPMIRPELYYEGVVIVIDLQRGRLIKEQRLPFVASYALGRNLVGVKREWDSGLAYLELYSLRLRN